MMPSGPEPQKQEHLPGSCTCADCTRVLRDLGSLTGWLLAGPPAPSPENQVELLEYCPNCGLQLQTQRPGSLTQWIFKFQICACQANRGTAAETSGPDLLPPADSEIDVDDDFPLDRFAPLKITAQGVNGTIYQSIDRVLFKTVAVKTLRSMDSRQYVAFQNEARAISMLDHPGIVRVLDFSLSVGGAPFMVMEFVGGESLDAYLRQHGPFGEEIALDVFAQIAEAIAHAHSKGVLHRDLKPENVLIEVLDTGYLEVKVVDFGLARIAQENLISTATGDRLMVGTPVYMSPDTMLGLDYDERSDVYSLGSLMFEILSGKLPFEAESPMELMTRKSKEDPPTLRQAGIDVRDEIESIVAKALQRDAERRYQSMSELLVDLRKARGEIPLPGPAPARPTTAEADSTGSVRAKTIPSRLVFGAAGLIVLGSLVWFSMTYSRLDEKTELSKSALAPTSETQLDDVAPELAPVGHFYRSQYRQYTIYTNPDPKLKSAHLEDLRECTDIDGVSVTDCPLTFRDMRFLAKQNLKVLSISKCRLPDRALAVIGEMPSLTELNLWLLKLNKRPLEFLGKLKNLRVLNIMDTGIEADQFEALSGLRTLERLNFSWSERVCKRRHFEIIAQLENLKLLDLEAVRPEPGDLALFKNLHRLDLLNIARNHLTDEHLKAISGIPSLKKLNLKMNEDLTPAGLGYLVASKSIEQVLVSGCPLISKKDAEAAMAKRPGLVIEVEGEGLANDSVETVKLFSF